MVRDASTVFTQQSAMAELVYKGSVVTGQVPGWSDSLIGSAIRASIAFIVGILLALTSVFGC